MVVVHHRPGYRNAIICLCLITLAAASWLSYRYGMTHGNATRTQVLHERDQIKHEFEGGKHLIESQRQQIANLKISNQVDAKATEEVRQTVASLQSKIADLNERISFYKAVMVPKAHEKGLRIERLQLKATDKPGKYHYGLLLTQLVEKHDYIQGGVKVTLLGTENEQERNIPLTTISSDASGGLKFRFRYFENLAGDLTIPDGFTPTQVEVVVQASGQHPHQVKQKFEWQIDEG